MAIKKRDETKKDSNSSAFTVGEPGVRKIVLHSSSYEDEASVKKYLDDNGYADFTITKSDNVFIAQGEGVTDDHFEKNSVKSVKMAEDGTVTGFVGKVAKSVEKAEKAEEDKSERTIKMDYWNMYDSSDQHVTGVIKDGMSDGVPPGAQEIMTATAIAIGNALKEAGSSRKGAITTIGGELSTLINATADMYDKVIDKAAKQTENTKKFIETFRADIDVLVAKAKAETTEKKEEVKVAAKKEDEKPAVEEPKKEEAVQAPAQVDAQVLAALVGKAIADAVQPLTDQLGQLGKKVDNVQTVAEDARNKSAKAADDVALVASQAPTKKSVGEQGNHSKSDEDRQKSVELSRKEGVNRFANALGMR